MEIRRRSIRDGRGRAPAQARTRDSRSVLAHQVVFGPGGDADSCNRSVRLLLLRPGMKRREATVANPRAERPRAERRHEVGARKQPLGRGARGAGGGGVAAAVRWCRRVLGGRRRRPGMDGGRGRGPAPGGRRVRQPPRGRRVFVAQVSDGGHVVSRTPYCGGPRRSEAAPGVAAAGQALGSPTGAHPGGRSQLAVGPARRPPGPTAAPARARYVLGAAEGDASGCAPSTGPRCGTVFASGRACIGGWSPGRAPATPHPVERP